MSERAKYSDRYTNYLKTDEWRRKRAERMEIDQCRCVLCGATNNLEVHHVYYDNLGNEDVDNDLMTLCKECHRQVHEDKDFLVSGIVTAYLALHHKDKMPEHIRKHLDASMRVIHVPVPDGGCLTIPFSMACHGEKDARKLCDYSGENYFALKNDARDIVKAFYGEPMYITEIGGDTE